jgi:hypothetical protein
MNPNRKNQLYSIQALNCCLQWHSSRNNLDTLRSLKAHRLSHSGTFRTPKHWSAAGTRDHSAAAARRAPRATGGPGGRARSDPASESLGPRCYATQLMQRAFVTLVLRRFNFELKRGV